jgi:inner membrane protein
MPSFLTHPAVPVAMALGFGRGFISWRLFTVGVAASMLPDLDVLTFYFGLPRAAEFGHRGFSHSIFFAIFVALIGASFFKFLDSKLSRAMWFLFVSTVSHAILDAFTTGGLGVAFFWPWSAERYFAPVRVIEAAPLSLSRFLSPRGPTVLLSEILWVWLPLMSAVGVTAFLRRSLLLGPDIPIVPLTGDCSGRDEFISTKL